MKWVFVVLLLFISNYSYGQHRAIDQICDNRSAQIDVHLVDKIPNIFESLTNATVQYIFDQSLSKNIETALIGRVLKIPPLSGKHKIKYCGRDKPKGQESIVSLYYDILSNEIGGCLPVDIITSEEQLRLVIAHELAHSFDPCGYGAGPSPLEFNFNNVGWVLGYSNKDNYKTSAQEYPLKKNIKLYS